MSEPSSLPPILAALDVSCMRVRTNVASHPSATPEIKALVALSN